MARRFLPRFRGGTTEATNQELVASGAAGGYGVDPIDGDRGYVKLGTSSRDQPTWTTEKQRAFSLAAYRANPMGRAIVDTYTSFCVGDSGVAPECDDPTVAAVVHEFWHNPRNGIAANAELLFRDWMLMGENIWEYMVGASGAVLINPISPSAIEGVTLERGNPLWHDTLVVRGGTTLRVARPDDFTGIRTGNVGYHPSWRAVITDRRGTPFLGPILDDLDAYAAVLSNLVDRTALSRYLAMHVVIDGEQEDVDDYIERRGGLHVPRSGSVEVTNKKVDIRPINLQSGSFEDTNTSLSVLTNVASGSGLAKTWLAESEGANRATSMSMAEPVRRRVGGVQNEWLGILTAHVRYAVDQAVAVGRLPRTIPQRTLDGDTIDVTPAELVRVVGPKIAAADSNTTATVMVNLGTAISSMIDAGVLTKEAGAVAVQAAWAQFVGRPFPASLAVSATIAPEQSKDDIQEAAEQGRLFLVS